jgi:hypothetical protein
LKEEEEEEEEELRRDTKVVPFQEKHSFHFVVL